MPYSSISEARIKKLNGVPLTLSQINSIAKQADAIGGDVGWPTAIKHFKKTHSIKDGHWVKKGGEEKEFYELFVEKEEDRYKIVGVSTAAVRDRENETFTVDAIDYDIQQAKEQNTYPEFRMFHKPYLAIGEVTEMRRAGIFAIDTGYSYKDDFSLSVCKMLDEDNTGKWRMSRGFYVIEANGVCPQCTEQLLVRTKHMLVGFKCPSCGTFHSGKGVLKDLHFRKTRTFDVTVTDVPAVPFTGVTAYKDLMEDVVMTKKELRKKLLDAGLEEDVVEARLGSITEKQLEAMDDIPFATVMKEILTEDEDDDDVTTKEDVDDDEQLFVLDPEVLKDFADVVVDVALPAFEQKMLSIMEGLQVDIGDLGDVEMEVKEIPGLVELKEQVEELVGQVSTLLQSDEERLKEMFAEAPRGAKFRIVREKGHGKKMTDEEDDEEEDEEEMTESKQLEGVIIGADGKQANSMTAFVTGQ